MRITHANTKLKFDYHLGNPILQETANHTYLGCIAVSGVYIHISIFVGSIFIRINESLGETDDPILTQTATGD